MATFTLEIATPEKLVFANEVSEAEIPGANGRLGILPGHAALISETDPGELYYVRDGKRFDLAIGDGWVEISNNKCRVLVDTCETPDLIDRTRAEAALKRANESLASPKDDMDIAQALNAMKRAQARIAVAKQSGE